MACYLLPKPTNWFLHHFASSVGLEIYNWSYISVNTLNQFGILSWTFWQQCCLCPLFGDCEGWCPWETWFALEMMSLGQHLATLVPDWSLAQSGPHVTACHWLVTYIVRVMWPARVKGRMHKQAAIWLASSAESAFWLWFS